MGRPDGNSQKVKEIVLEVENKTKTRNLVEYLMDMGKLSHSDVYIALERGGRAIGDDATMSQILKNVRPVNGVIKLYLYDLTKEQIAEKAERAQLRRSRDKEISNSNIFESQLESPGRKNMVRKKESVDEEGGGCCCF